MLKKHSITLRQSYIPYLDHITKEREILSAHVSQVQSGTLSYVIVLDFIRHSQKILHGEPFSFACSPCCVMIDISEGGAVGSRADPGPETATLILFGAGLGVCPRMPYSRTGS